jgi:hypothetical protein
MLTMTPQARAIAAFTLATIALIGWLNRLAVTAYVTFGGDLAGGEGSQLVLGLLIVALAGGVFWFAHATAGSGVAGWETNLAQAGRILAGLALLVAVLATISVFTSDRPFYGSVPFIG